LIPAHPGGDLKLKAAAWIAAEADLRFVAPWVQLQQQVVEAEHEGTGGVDLHRRVLEQPSVLPAPPDPHAGIRDGTGVEIELHPGDLAAVYTQT
jgi:hypothetical protein